MGKLPISANLGKFSLLSCDAPGSEMGLPEAASLAAAVSFSAGGLLLMRWPGGRRGAAVTLLQGLPQQEGGSRVLQ